MTRATLALLALAATACGSGTPTSPTVVTPLPAVTVTSPPTPIAPLVTCAIRDVGVNMAGPWLEVYLTSPATVKVDVWQRNAWEEIRDGYTNAGLTTRVRVWYGTSEVKARYRVRVAGCVDIEKLVGPANSCGGCTDDGPSQRPPVVGPTIIEPPVVGPTITEPPSGGPSGQPKQPQALACSLDTFDVEWSTVSGYPDGRHAVATITLRPGHTGSLVGGFYLVTTAYPWDDRLYLTFDVTGPGRGDVALIDAYPSGWYNAWTVDLRCSDTGKVISTYEGK